MTYHKQFSKSRPCAPGLCRELCSGLHNRMQHDGRHSSGFVLRIDRLTYDTYDITNTNLPIQSSGNAGAVTMSSSESDFYMVIRLGRCVQGL